MRKPEVCVLKTDGINCDEEMKHAFSVGGGEAVIVHVNELLDGAKNLKDFQALGIPGGFSYGDDIASGRVLASELTHRLADQVQEFVDDKKPIIGVCNGFQALVKSGLLPGGELGRQTTTLTENTIGHFVCRWVEVEVSSSVCKFIQPGDFEVLPIPIQTAHGEGLFTGFEEALDGISANQQVVFRYAAPDQGHPAPYPHNPNGSVDDIAGICDPSGLILGMMPHPERSLTAFHPYRPKTYAAQSAGKVIFKNMINYTKGM